MELQTDCFPQHVEPARAYRPAHDLWVITSFFNSQQYSSKYKNFILFRDSLERSGVNYLVVECAFKGQPFTIPASSRVFHVVKTNLRPVFRSLIPFLATVQISTRQRS